VAVEKGVKDTPAFALDTNIVLDWLVFHAPWTERLQEAVSERRVAIVTHEPAIDELRRVLTYPQCKLTEDVQRELLTRYQGLSRSADMPVEFSRENLLLPAGFPRCRDCDDQHFLALAYHANASGLVSKDKLLLKLRRKAARFGVTLLTPQEFVDKLTLIGSPGAD
jgi:uncharacterized protein